MVFGFGAGTVLNLAPLQFAAFFDLSDLAVGGLGETGPATVHVSAEDLVELLEAAGLKAINGRELNPGTVRVFVHALLLEANEFVGGSVVELGDEGGDLSEIHVEARVAPVRALGHSGFKEAFGLGLVNWGRARGEGGGEEVEFFQLAKPGDLPALNVENIGAGGQALGQVAVVELDGNRNAVAQLVGADLRLISSPSSA